MKLEINKKKLIKGVPTIEVSGGVVQEVHSVKEYVLIDWDNIKSDDEHKQELIKQGYIIEVE